MRFEVVRHGQDHLHQSWCSPDGSLVLLRDQGSSTWRAVIDFVVVHDADSLNSGTAMQAEVLLEAPSAPELAALLARQENVHVIFDA